MFFIQVAYKVAEFYSQYQNEYFQGRITSAYSMQVRSNKTVGTKIILVKCTIFAS